MYFIGGSTVSGMLSIVGMGKRELPECLWSRPSQRPGSQFTTFGGCQSSEKGVL